VTTPDCVQVSAVGVWDTPLALAVRAADIVTALPSAHLYSRLQQHKMVEMAIVTRLALPVFNNAAAAFEDPTCCSPLMPKAQLLGQCLAGSECKLPADKCSTCLMQGQQATAARVCCMHWHSRLHAM
jgi:hypothetical protein